MNIHQFYKTVVSVSEKLPMSAETLRKWVRQHEIDNSEVPGITTSENEHLKKLERENKELRRANEILRDASIFLIYRAGRSNKEVVAYIDSRKSRWGVQPICKVLHFAPSTYYATISRSPSNRSVADEDLKVKITRIYEDNLSVYGTRKIWAELKRQGVKVARCSIERLMSDLAIVGVSKSKSSIRTTIADELADRPQDLVNRQFKADRPNEGCVADITYVNTTTSKAYVAFVIDVLI